MGLIFLSSCSSRFNTAETELASKIEENLGCQNFRSEVFNSLYGFINTQESSPSAEGTTVKLKQKILEMPIKDLKVKQDLANAVVSLYNLLNAETVKNFKLNSETDHLQTLIQLEFENSSTQLHKKMNSQIQKAFAKVVSLASEADISCQNPVENRPQPPLPVEPTPIPNDVNNDISRAYYGALFTFATAYQTCESLNLLPIDKSTQNVVGVQLGEKNGQGYRREYGNIRQIASTHYYIKDMNYSSGCFPLNQKPLVYDYGGQPAVDVKNNLINFFANSGSGGKALGIDCSAFVSSALATAGLKYTPEINNKPIYIRQSSSNFIDPKTSNWKCFDRISVSPNQSIVSGDIMAINGHVVMIDQAGSDPFGIKKMTTLKQCENLDVVNFDFTIMQSSPSKGSIGINRYRANDYLPEAGRAMQEGFLKYAKAACTAWVESKKYTPAYSSVGIIRHKGTPECLDHRVQLTSESCIRDCEQLKNIGNNIKH